MAHHHPTGIARQAPRRFRGNVLASVEHGLAGLIRVGQGGGVDVDHHMVAFARGARIDPVVQGRLGEEAERVGLLLRLGRRVVHRAGDGCGEPGGAAPLVQRFPRGA